VFESEGEEMRQRRIRHHRKILASLTQSILPVAAATIVLSRGQFVHANTPATWEGTAGDYLWTSPTNWSIDAVPPTTSPYDDLTFGNGTPGTISLNGNEFANSLTFNTSGFTLDSSGSTNVLTNATGSITVGSTDTATINSILAGSTSLKLSGGGTLILNNDNTYTGATNVNAGTLEVGAASAIYPSGVLTVSSGAAFLIDIPSGPSTVTFNTSVSNSGSFTIDSGDSFVSNTSGSVFTQSAGTLTVTGTLNTGGQGFNYSGGTVVGTVQIGSNSTVPTLSFASGVGNSGAFVIGGEGATFGGAVPRVIQTNQSMTLAPTAATGTLSVSANISNQGSLTLSGTSTATATLAMGTDTLTNTGTLTTAANLTPSTVTDVITAAINNSTGTVNINASATVNSFSVINSSAFTIASGVTLNYPGPGTAASAFTQSAGSLTIDGSLVLGIANFNDNGGTVTGTVTMGAAAFTGPTLTFGAGAGNSGAFVFTGQGGFDVGSVPTGVTLTLEPTATSGNLSLPSGFVNNGTMNLIGSTTSTATFTGNSTLTNSGILTTSNTGTPSTVNQIIVKVLNNTSTGTVNVNASLTVGGTVTNNGTIDIASNQTLNMTSGPTFNQNGGQINVSAGGILDLSNAALTLNGGTITLAAGASSQGVLRLGTTQFTGSTTTGTIASGTVGMGQSPGYVDLAGTTSTLAIGSGTQPAQVIISAPITDGGIVKSGAGTLELSGANTYALGTTVTAGKLLVEPTSPTTSALPNGPLSISGGTVQLVDNVTAGTALAASNVQLTSLSITGTGTLDIGNNRIIIDYTTGNDPIASIESWISNGYYGVSGPAIISSDITTDDSASGLSYGIGYADGADNEVAGLPSGEIEIMYTLLGDANLDGTVNSEDFSPFSHNLGQSGQVWDDGDFNYDGTVNSEDFSSFSHNLGQTASLAASTAGVLETANGISLANVPEPGCAVLSLIAAVGLLQPRFRKRNPPICKSTAGA
jgi:fibronectin-binding autotransporter adhesin